MTAPSPTSGLASYAEIAIPVPLDRTFVYRVPEALRGRVEIGRRVLVPFGRRTGVRGFVVSTPETTDVPGLKDVAAVLDDAPVLARDVLAVCRFVSRYYACSLGEALEAALPAGVKKARAARTVPHAELAVPPEEAIRLAREMPEPQLKQARVLETLVRVEEPMPVADLLRAAKSSRSPVHTLARAGTIRIRDLPVPDDPLEAARAVRTLPHDLTGEQARCVREIVAAVSEGQFRTFLLFGVTGSGKTEVYLQAIRDCVARGKQAIVLVPEISLTPQTVRRFRGRFDRVAVLHSGQSEAERRKWWKKVQAGESDVVIGPRSAVFAPVPRLGLIVVDEEHDTSFKQNRSPRYHARDVAVVRASGTGAAVVLGSATPALESWHNARTGKYTMLTLTERLGGGTLPPVEIVDMGREMQDTKRFTHFSRRLRLLLSETLERGEQAMLFLNRRGFSTLLLCRRCGEALTCERCSVSLTYHQGFRRATCHLCGYERSVPDACPACAQPGLLHRGFGTEKVEEEISALFPQARIARMDSDTMTGRGAHEKVLQKVEAGELDLLVGTQMIAKGLHLPGVTAVGVVDADTSLRLPDFRAAERTFQLIAQVAGRAGRGVAGGHVVVQTFRPDQPSLIAAAAHDFLAFAEEELRQREAFGYPPFGRLVLVVVQGTKVAAVTERAREIARELAGGLGGSCQVLGPAIPPVEKVKDRLRRQIVVKAPGPREIAKAVRILRAATGAGHPGVETIVDVDPVGMM